MNISPVMTIIFGEVVIATPAPRGGFWMARIQGERAAFFGCTATEQKERVLKYLTVKIVEIIVDTLHWYSMMTTSTKETDK